MFLLNQIIYSRHPQGDLRKCFRVETKCYTYRYAYKLMRLSVCRFAKKYYDSINSVTFSDYKCVCEGKDLRCEFVITEK